MIDADFWKDLEVTRGPLKRFDRRRCYFYRADDGESSAGEIVIQANRRCDQRT